MRGSRAALVAVAAVAVAAVAVAAVLAACGGGDDSLDGPEPGPKPKPLDKRIRHELSIGLERVPTVTDIDLEDVAETPETEILATVDEQSGDELLETTKRMIVVAEKINPGVDINLTTLDEDGNELGAADYHASARRGEFSTSLGEPEPFRLGSAPR